MPPRHDFRGGKASADSFAMSSIALVISMKRSFVAVEIHELVYMIADGPISYTNLARCLSHSPIGVIFSEGWT